MNEMSEMQHTPPIQPTNTLEPKEAVQPSVAPSVTPNIAPNMAPPSATANVSSCDIVELPSGKHAEVSEGRGRDLKAASKMANGADEFDFMFCLISVLCKVDGQRLLPEDIEDLSLADLTAIQAALFQKTGLGGSQAQGKSQG